MISIINKRVGLRRGPIWPTGCMFVLAILSASAIAPVAAQQGEMSAPNPAIEHLSAVPLAFTANVGQFDERVLYRADAAGATVWITTDGVYHQFLRGNEPDRQPGQVDEPDRDSMKLTTVRTTFSGGDPDAVAVPEQLLLHKSNFFLGDDPQAWFTNVDNFGAVRLSGVYPDIDVLFRGNGRQLEYDFIIAPGGDPSQIRVTYDGIETLAINAAGDLEIGTASGTIIEHRPVTYQIEPNGKVSVTSEFVLYDGNTMGFRLPEGYDRSRALTIDPALVYSSYLGGTFADAVYGIAVDSVGQACVTGYTTSTDFPTLNQYQGDQGGTDTYVTKFNAAGNGLVYSTYLGGSNVEYGRDVAVDRGGNALVVGYTFSTDFPTQSPYQTDQPQVDAFVTKLNAAGNGLVFSTYLGGSSADYGESIALDGVGAAHVTGYTTSTNFPLKSAYQLTNAGGEEVFVTRFQISGSTLAFSTYLGGWGNDRGNGITVDRIGEVYVTGQTKSINFPTVNPIQGSLSGSSAYNDAFISKFNATGALLIYSTYLGGTNDDVGAGIDVDNAFQAHVAGYAKSTDFPTTSPLQGTHGDAGAYYDAFVTMVNAAGSAHIYSTYLGGSGDDKGRDVAVESGTSIAYVTGETGSTDFPTAVPLQDTLGGGSQDAFATGYDSVGTAYIYSTFLGGSNTDRGSSAAVNDSGCAFFGIYTQSTDFPTLNPYQGSNAGSWDGAVVKICEPPDNNPPVALCTDTTVYADENCEADVSVDAGSYDPDGHDITLLQEPPSPYSPGVTVVDLIVIDIWGAADTCQATVTVIDSTSPTAVCPGDTTLDNDAGQCGATVSFLIDATDNCPGVSVVATPPSGSFFPVGLSPVQVVATDASGNADTCLFNVTVNDAEHPVAICPDDTTVAADPGGCSAVVSYTIDATDNCEGVTVVADPPSGSSFSVGVTIVEVIATDAAGKKDTCYFDVFVTDDTPPTAICPGDTIVGTDPGDCGAVVTFVIEGTDNCPGVEVVADPSSGSYFEVGVTQVEVVATDAGGNADTCYFTVTVDDTEPPVAVCPNDTTAGTDPGQCGAVVNFPINVTDNCPGASVVASPASGTFFPIGTTPVRLIATDAVGFKDTCYFDVTVEDKEQPVAVCPGDTSVSADPGQCSATVAFAIDADDNCPGVVVQASPPSGSVFDVGDTPVEVIATDAAGNKDTCYFTVTITDDEPPVLTEPGNIEVPNDPGLCGAIVEFSVPADDNCPGVIVLADPPSGSFFEVGVTAVQVVAADASGNADTAFFDVTVLDTEPPEAVCPQEVIVDNLPDQCEGVATYEVSATDNCPGVTVAADPPSGSRFPVGSSLVEVIATDSVGHADTCYITVTVNDAEWPVVTCPDDIVVGNDVGECGAVVGFEPTWTDNCPGSAVASDPPSGSFFGVGLTTVEVVAADLAGNADTCYFDVTVNDTEAPVANCPEDIEVFNDSGAYGAVVEYDVSGSDNCAVATAVADPPSGSFFPIGTTYVQTAVADSVGLADTCQFAVAVLLNDPDSDGLPNWDDNCPLVYNPGQDDFDGDGVGDSCDTCTDTDDDGYGDPGFPANTCALDNCPDDYNPDQADLNGDGVGDECCCVDMRGNCDGDSQDKVNIVDLTYLIAYLFGGGPPPGCPDESNLDGSPDGATNIVDLTHLVAYLFGGGDPPAECP